MAGPRSAASTAVVSFRCSCSCSCSGGVGHYIPDGIASAHGLIRLLCRNQVQVLGCRRDYCSLYIAGTSNTTASAPQRLKLTRRGCRHAACQPQRSLLSSSNFTAFLLGTRNTSYEVLRNVARHPAGRTFLCATYICSATVRLGSMTAGFPYT